jgi:multiple sugar transport system permease protein
MAEAVQQRGAARTRRVRSPAATEAITGWLFAMPWIIGFGVFTLGPMLFSLYTSFTRYNITTAPEWIGLNNYQSLFRDPFFYTSLKNTFWIVVFKTPLVVVVSIAIALLLNMDLPGGKAFRTIFYLPNVLAGVAAVFLWQWILAPNGLFNRGLAVFGIDGPSWFSNPAWTKPGLVVMGMWWIGGNILIYLAGLKGIPAQLYEAAEIDGATGLAQTWYITLPMLSPTIFFQVVTGIIGAFQIFTTAYIITGNQSATGGPGQSLLFYVLYLYNRAFGRVGAGGFQMGYASAMAWILFLIILAVTLVQLSLAKRWVYYETEGR